jgi:hypothetical protein
MFSFTAFLRRVPASRQSWEQFGNVPVHHVVRDVGGQVVAGGHDGALAALKQLEGSIHVALYLVPVTEREVATIYAASDEAV